MYITKSALDTYLAAAELTTEDRPLVAHVRPLVAAIDADDGIVNEANTAEVDALATALGITRGEVYKVARLAIAAGLLVQV